MKYPDPKIGYYRAECCLICLYQIVTEEDLQAANERIEDNDEVGPLMIFATLAEAIAELGDDGHDEATLQREFARLGWVP